MNKNHRFAILTEGQKNGVSITCQKYNISRTIYYRWLDRYKTRGLSGLEDTPRNYIPANKTEPSTERLLLKLFCTYPDYGPKAIKYLMEEMDVTIGESAIFNVMKRYGLTNKKSRLQFANSSCEESWRAFPDIKKMESGECWLCWITNYGPGNLTSALFEYTIMDYNSKIACSRLYSEIRFANFENLLSAVAIPVADSLKLTVKHFCYFQDWSPSSKRRKSAEVKICRLFQNYGYDVQVHAIPLRGGPNDLFDTRHAFTKDRITHMLPHLTEEKDSHLLKSLYQQEIRCYNIYYKQPYPNGLLTPIAYHYKITESEPVLPLWAYMERDY